MYKTLGRKPTSIRTCSSHGSKGLVLPRTASRGTLQQTIVEQTIVEPTYIVSVILIMVAVEMQPWLHTVMSFYPAQ
jgi:hypothetical protein